MKKMYYFRDPYFTDGAVIWKWHVLNLQSYRWNAQLSDYDINERENKLICISDKYQWWNYTQYRPVNSGFTCSK